MGNLIVVFTFAGLAVLFGALMMFLVLMLIRRRGRRTEAPAEIRSQTITERVRSVGKLVGLEVSAQEIATAKHGWSWMPPLLLSEARLAMIFRFEKQYHVDLGAIGAGDVSRDEDGRWIIEMPQVEGSLHLVDVKPYDVQQGRALGLLDVIQMNAERQSTLMDQARTQAASLFEHSDARYRVQAAEAIERQLRQLLSHLGVECVMRWSSGDAPSQASRSLAQPAPVPMPAPAPVPAQAPRLDPLAAV